MLTPEQARTLYDYNAWANHRILDACAVLTDEQFSRDLGSSFRSVRGTLVHILGGEWFWLARWRDRLPTALPRADEYPNLASLRAHWEEVERNLLQFVGTRTAEDLARVHHYRTTEGNPNSQPFWQMMQHVVNHSTHYRGQVTTLLRQLGATPVATDLILYYRENRGTQVDPMNPETIRLLYDYNSWANSRLLDSCAQLNEEQFTRDLGSSFPSVRDTLVHILGAEWLWLERWHGRSHSAMPPSGEFPDPASVQARWAGIGRDLLQFVAGLAPADAARVSEYRTTKGVPYSNPLWESLQHLVNHSTYHRGQAAAMLRQLGVKPNFTDLIYFYRERAGQALD